MPWFKAGVNRERLKFIREYQAGYYSRSELCDRFGVSRKTGYKRLERYDQLGQSGLEDRSRAPLSNPRAVSPEVAELLVATRKAHPAWGPGKILAYLDRRHPGCCWPAHSTIGRLFSKRGLVKSKRRRRKHLHPGVVPPTTKEPNDLWTADFKGDFLMKDGNRCTPLTIADQHTRYLIVCKGLLSRHMKGVREEFERTFYEFGLTRAIRTDNDSPFAGTGIHEITKLNVWWMRLGIRHQRTRRACPQDNGAYEQMHRTLKAATCIPPKASLRYQQRAFNSFLREYNEDRPHEYLDNDTPASRYTSSPREYTGKLPKQEYPSHFEVKPVTTGGTFRLKQRLVFISNSFHGHKIGMEEVDDGVWNVYLNEVLLGKVDERDFKIRS